MCVRQQEPKMRDFIHAERARARTHRSARKGKRSSMVERLACAVLSVLTKQLQRLNDSLARCKWGEM